jgi:hypothetical protein
LFHFLKEYSQDTKAGNKETFVWYTGTQKKNLGMKSTQEPQTTHVPPRSSPIYSHEMRAGIFFPQEP